MVHKYLHKWVSYTGYYDGTFPYYGENCIEHTIKVDSMTHGQIQHLSL